MKFLTSIILMTLSMCVGSFTSNAQTSEPSGLNIDYVENSIKFSAGEKNLITKTVTSCEKSIRRLLPDLPKNIKVIVEIMPRKIDEVGGTTGRAQKHDPDGEVYVYISSLYPGGVTAAVNASLSYTIHHEFHHLARGWSMIGNKYGKGIDIAMVNEGLAVVFAEVYSHQLFEGNSIPAEAEKWVLEVLDLPIDANYNSWMNQHPDGRMGIGYRSGSFVVRRAMGHSGKDILEMTQLEPETIIELAGYKMKER